jgi:hypothetical protein
VGYDGAGIDGTLSANEGNRISMNISGLIGLPHQTGSLHKQ